MTKTPEYQYRSSQAGHHHSYLLPTLDRVIADYRPTQIFDLGCGNGSTANHISRHCKVVGVDPSDSAVAQANLAYPNVRIEVGSAYDDLSSKFGKFPMAISLEVVEHLYYPRKFARAMFELVEPNGIAVISTPYHGYLKNVALAISGKMDSHFTALWDGGHIKFWSFTTLSELLNEAGFEVMQGKRVGRIPPLAKSLIMIARRPAA
jgi:2-polyprenyl-3-methyl-5-hydroxy-6-metoxy-1,4-benzoquinol methylase